MLQECKKNIPHVKFTVVDVISKKISKEFEALADKMGNPLRVRTGEY